MGLLDWLFRAWHRRDRLAREPAGHTGGRLPPASVQRAHLGVRDVDLPAGVVRLRTGEVRAILAVGGVPLHHRDPADALAFLERWAAALNGMPADVAMLARARPGGLGGYVAERSRAAAALATAAPGTGLARLAADQLRNAVSLVSGGRVRSVVGYLAVRDARGDVRALGARAGAAADRLTSVGLRVTPLRDRALATAISDSWRPGWTESSGVDVWTGRRGEGAEWTLVVDSDARTTRARVRRPRYVDSQPDPEHPLPPPTISKPRRSLSGGPRKALP